MKKSKSIVGYTKNNWFEKFVKYGSSMEPELIILSICNKKIDKLTYTKVRITIEELGDR
jgi:hypothetical protein